MLSISPPFFSIFRIIAADIPAGSLRIFSLGWGPLARVPRLRFFAYQLTQANYRGWRVLDRLNPKHLTLNRNPKPYIVIEIPAGSLRIFSGWKPFARVPRLSIFAYQLTQANYRGWRVLDRPNPKH